MAQMTRQERLQAAIRGDDVDRVPVTLWRHWPGDDQRAEDLARAHLVFQRQYDFDFIKVSPASSFCVEDWGAETRYMGNNEGTREHLRRVVRQPEDWGRLPVLNPRQGALGRQLRCLELIGQEVGDEVPFIQTVFNPLSVARYLAGDRTLLAHMRQHPAAVREGLATITESLTRFVAEVARTGASGIFLAVQHANYHLLGEEEYGHLGTAYDQRVLQTAGEMWFNVLHLHGQNIMFDLLARYPVAAVNWHDRETPPTLAEAQTRTDRALIGGLRQVETMLRGTPEGVRAEAADAIVQTGGRRFILGTGCVTFITSPTSNIYAARDAAEQ